MTPTDPDKEKEHIMSSTTLTERNTASVMSAPRHVPRLLGAGGAVLAAVAVWALAVHAFGVTLRAPGTGGAAADIGVGHVVAASAVASLAGWAALALLERWTLRAARIWTGLALGVLVVSLGGPLSGTGISVGNRVALLALHLAVAAVLVPLLSRSARRGPFA